MEPIDLKHKYVDKRHAQRKAPVRVFPFTHVLVVGALAVILAVVAMVPSEEASASRQAQTLALPVLEELAAPLEEEALLEPLVAATTQKQESVKSGDTLSAIFHRAGLNDKALFEVIQSSEAGKALARLYPGHTFIFELDEQGALTKLSHIIDNLNSQTFTRVDNSFQHQTHTKTPDVKYAMRSGTIESSLYNAGIEANLDDELIMELASIFGWDVDFALDIRKGDSFKILYEESFLDGERIGVGHILAAEFVNQNTTFKAVRYVDSNNKAQYFTPDGKAMQKAFLRAPLDFRRISSNFNPKRLHPISKTVKPHRGTDYAANRGTPVWAAGEGRVVASGYTKANGNYVVIQHGGEIQTKYLHLHKRSVKTGQRVKQKQIIGTVGSTGYSTAPHLHYEFLLNGVHRNPRTIVQKLPKAKSIDKEDLPRFFAQTQPLLAELEQTTRYAYAMDEATQKL